MVFVVTHENHGNHPYGHLHKPPAQITEHIIAQNTPLYREKLRHMTGRYRRSTARIVSREHLCRRRCTNHTFNIYSVFSHSLSSFALCARSYHRFPPS